MSSWGCSLIGPSCIGSATSPMSMSKSIVKRARPEVGESWRKGRKRVRGRGGFGAKSGCKGSKYASRRYSDRQKIGQSYAKATKQC